MTDTQAALAALHVDANSPVAPFEQVKIQVIALVDAGALAAGTRLPPVRTLAQSLDLAANTVARAYKELEAAGVVETRGRAGTYVSGAGVDRAARAAALRYAEASRALGLERDRAHELLDRVWT